MLRTKIQILVKGIGFMSKKKNYTDADLEIVLFDEFDVITTSGNASGGSTEDGWGSPGDLDQGAWD